MAHLWIGYKQKRKTKKASSTADIIRTSHLNSTIIIPNGEIFIERTDSFNCIRQICKFAQMRQTKNNNGIALLADGCIILW